MDFMHLNGVVHVHDSLLAFDALCSARSAPRHALHAPRAALGVARTARALATLRMAPRSSPVI